MFSFGFGFHSIVTVERGGMPHILTDFQKVADAETVTTDRDLIFLKKKKHVELYLHGSHCTAVRLRALYILYDIPF